MERHERLGRTVGVSGELAEILVSVAGKSDSGLDAKSGRIGDLETKFTRADLGHKRGRDKTERKCADYLHH